MATFDDDFLKQIIRESEKLRRETRELTSRVSSSRQSHEREMANLQETMKESQRLLNELKQKVTLEISHDNATVSRSSLALASVIPASPSLLAQTTVKAESVAQAEAKQVIFVRRGVVYHC